MVCSKSFVILLLIAVFVDLIFAATKASVSDTQIVISDSQDPQDIQEGKKV